MEVKTSTHFSPHSVLIMHPTCIEPAVLYGQNPELNQKDVKIVQEWLKKQPHLPKLEETQLILFLHSRYYRIEAAKVAIDTYFTRKTFYPHIFGYSPEDSTRRFLTVGFNAIMPKKTPEGYHIFVSKLLDFKTENYDFLTSLKVISMVASLHLHKNGAGNGVVAVFDTKGFGLGHLAKFNLTVFKHLLDHVQEGLPIRIKGVHFVNTVPFMDKILGLVKPFLKGEIYSTIQLHSSLETLYKCVPKECLPEDYGGYLPPIQTIQDETLETLLTNMDFFKWHDSQKVDESKRVEKLHSINNTFGVDGTFKKLELD